MENASMTLNHDQHGGRVFRQLQQSHSALRPFGSSESMVAMLANLHRGTRHERDQLTTSLVVAAQRVDYVGPFAREVLWNGFGTRLHVMNRTRASAFGCNGDEFTSELYTAFVDAIQAFHPARIKAAENTLLGNTGRRLIDALLRERKKRRRSVELIPDAIDGNHPSVCDASDTSVDEQSLDERVAKAQRLLDPIVGERTALLLVDFHMRGIPLKESADRLGLSYDAAKKAVERGRSTLRKEGRTKLMSLLGL